MSTYVNIEHKIHMSYMAIAHVQYTVYNTVYIYIQCNQPLAEKKGVVVHHLQCHFHNHVGSDDMGTTTRHC